MKIGDCSMNLKLHFKNIRHNPCCKILVNNLELYSGQVKSYYDFDIDVTNTVSLEIVHFDKKPEDTIVDHDGKIIDDRSFELEKIYAEQHDFKELIWKSNFTDTAGKIYNSCLFFGPNGSFTIEFTIPVLRWILQNSEHIKDWEDDYPYYEKAFTILESIND